MDTEKSEVCLVCGEKGFSEKDMIDHIKNFHAVIKNDCPFCHYESFEPSDLEIHINTVHALEMLTPGKNSIIDIPTTSISKGSRNGHCSKTNRDVEMLACPVCDKTGFSSVNSLNEHTENHFIDDEPTQSNYTSDELMAIRMQEEEDNALSLKNRQAAENLYFEELRDLHGMGQKHQGTGFTKQALKMLDRAVGRKKSSTFEYYSNKLEMLEKLEKGIDDSSTTLPDVFESLQKHLNVSVKTGIKAWLSSPTYFIGRGPGDTGWGCGYRNIQMLISSLNKHPNFADIMKKNFSGNVPSIPKLQKMIEASWSEGFDVRGKEQLESKLYGTRKWIGATEAFAFFASLGLHCRIIDFPSPSGGAKNMHPLLLNWVQQYFGEDCHSQKVCVTDKPPLYLQHEGHSQTIIGISCDDDSGQNTSHTSSNPPKWLVFFDPGISKYEAYAIDKSKNLANSRTLCFSKFIKPVSRFNKKQYQVVCVEGIATVERKIKQKDVDSLCEKILPGSH